MLRTQTKNRMLAMIVIEGRGKIQAFFQKELDCEWKRLERKYRRVRWKILFALLATINYRFPSIADANLYLFNQYLRTLDEILNRGWSMIDLKMKQEEVNRYLDLVSSEFLALGLLRIRLMECKAFKVDRIVFEENQSIFEIDLKPDSAFMDWRREYRLDERWIDFYYEESRKNAKIAKHVRRELKTYFGVTHELLYFFNQFMNRRIEGNLRLQKRTGSPFVCFSAEQLLAILRTELPPLGRLDLRQAEEFLKELEYAPRKSWNHSPLVKLRHNRDIVFVPIFPAFYPSNTFSGSWVYHIAKVARNSSALGVMGMDWGATFERYVRSKLQECHPSLVIDPSSAVLSPSLFPDI